MMFDEHCNQVIRLLLGHVLERVIPTTVAALVGLLVGVELGIYEEAVLQAVNSHLGSFFISHGAQVAENLQSTSVRLDNRCTKRRARDICVGLERRDTVVGPEANCLTGIPWPRQNLR